MTKFRVGDKVKLKYNQENLKYFRIQGFLNSYSSKPPVTEHDMFEVVRLGKSTLRQQLIVISRISDERMFTLFDHRLELCSKPYDPNQEPEDDCI